MRRLSFQIALLLICPAILAAQSNGAPGLFSGSGFTLTPDTYIAPKAQLRLDVSRLSYLRSGYRGSNNVVLSAGMSPNLEVYIRLVGEQTGAITSDVATAYGGKFLLPFRLPALREAALWFEAASNEAGGRAGIFSQQMNRAAFIGSAGPNGEHATFLAGFAYDDRSSTPLGGIGWVQPLSHAAVVSPEATYGYFGKNSYALMLNGAVRLLGYASLQVSPGYCRANGVTTGLITAGISISTAAFDFNSRTAETKMRQDILLPTIEEMEKETPKQEPKDQNEPGGMPGSNLDPSIDSKGENR